MRPCPTGSPTFTITMGIVVVAFLAARAAWSMDTTRTSGLSWTSSAARRGSLPQPLLERLKETASRRRRPKITDPPGVPC
jgi:hypothetical protein